MIDSWMILLFMALTLGLRHGLDLDHLSIIDSITRATRRDLYFSKLTGVLFSMGHGLVVIFVSLIIGSGIAKNHFPVWLDNLGNIISLSFLLIFSLITFISVFTNSGHSHSTSKFGNIITSRILKRNTNPLFTILVGALYALSFDTLSQVALFSLSASQVAGCLFSGILGVTFTLGMLISDGLNGLITSIIIKRSDAYSVYFSRLIGFIIACFSLTVSIINLITIFKGKSL